MHKGGAVPGSSVPFGAVWGRGGLRMPLSALRGWALAVLAALAPAERSRPYAVLQKQNLGKERAAGGETTKFKGWEGEKRR